MAIAKFDIKQLEKVLSNYRYGIPKSFHDAKSSLENSIDASIKDLHNASEVLYDSIKKGKSAMDATHYKANSLDNRRREVGYKIREIESHLKDRIRERAFALDCRSYSQVGSSCGGCVSCLYKEIEHQQKRISTWTKDNPEETNRAIGIINRAQAKIPKQIKIGNRKTESINKLNEAMGVCTALQAQMVGCAKRLENSYTGLKNAKQQNENNLSLVQNHIEALKQIKNKFPQAVAGVEQYSSEYARKLESAIAAANRYIKALKG
ncbi:MAG: hypothetical protein FWB72_05650 [Firmicutes bacterium]|nr:hypothetical protein [Bacillota bacterium]